VQKRLLKYAGAFFRRV